MSSNIPSFCDFIVFYSVKIDFSLWCPAFIDHLLLGGHAVADSERLLSNDVVGLLSDLEGVCFAFS